MDMEHSSTGSFNEEPSSHELEWKHIAIRSQSLEHFSWEIVCDEMWVDPHKNAYECRRITRKAKGLGGYLYAVATHITPQLSSVAPSVSESLIFVPVPGDVVDAA